jgi:hypothetical protein
VLLDRQREAKTIAAPANQPVFLKFGQLSIGSHRLIVTPAYRNPELDAGSRRIGVQANLRILIRQPHRWVPGTSGHAGLIVTTDPYEPSLDALLEGRVRVSIYGPEGRTVACRLEFLDEAGKVLAFESLGNIRIPMPPNAWQSIIEEWAQKNADPSNYLGASAGRLTVEAEGLGSSRIWLSHAHVPIRWLAKGGRNIELRLVDDTAQENPTTVEFASFRTPTSPAALIIEDLSQSITPDGNGGLYLAATGQYRAGVVVSVQRRVGRLQELAERPALQSTLTDRAEVASLLRWIRDWSMARVVGPLAAQRRSITVRGMQDQLFASVCGRRWYGAESGFRDLGAQGTGAREMLENAVSSNHVSFAIGLARARDEVLLASIESSARSLLAHTARHRICSDFNLCEAALRLAGTPAHFADWAGQQLDKLLDELRQFSALIRAARMLVLLADDDEKLRIEGWTQ